MLVINNEDQRSSRIASFDHHIETDLDAQVDLLNNSVHYSSIWLREIVLMITHRRHDCENVIFKIISMVLVHQDIDDNQNFDVSF